MSDFVLNFYTSLAFGCSINQALDQATYFMGTPSETTFGQSFLYNGYINQNPVDWSVECFGSNAGIWRWKHGIAIIGDVK